MVPVEFLHLPILVSLPLLSLVPFLPVILCDKTTVCTLVVSRKTCKSSKFRTSSTIS